jgi:probable rRNA maturation factor
MKRTNLKKSTPLVTIVRRTASVRVPRKDIAALVTFILRAEGIGVSEVEIAIVGDGEMKVLNRRYHHVEGTTDVLSFDLSEPAGPLCAEIVVCADEAVRQAQRRRCRPQQELLLYVTHGLLHLLGYDDSTAGKARRMTKRQDELLAEFKQCGL